MSEYKYALVLVNVANLGTRTFSYLIPPELQAEIEIGQPVLVSFGSQGIVNAFVVGFSNYLPDNIKAKSINDLEFSSSTLILVNDSEIEDLFKDFE